MIFVGLRRSHSFHEVKKDLKNHNLKKKEEKNDRLISFEFGLTLKPLFQISPKGFKMPFEFPILR